MKRTIGFLFLFFLLFTGTVCAAGQVRSKSDLNKRGMIIGVGTGDIAELAVLQEFPNAKIAYYDDKFSGYESVASGKIDAFVYDLRQMELTIESGRAGVQLLDETMDWTTKIAVGISSVSKIPDLENQVNRFIAQMGEAGTLNEMYQRWVVENREEMPPLAAMAQGKAELHLTVGTSGIVPPYSYYGADGLTGYDIELAERFAYWLGADLTFKVYDYGSIIAAASTGQIDVIMANLQVMDERAENFLFSDTLYEEKLGIMVRDADPAEDAKSAALISLWNRVSSSFEKTFIRENRWKLFAEGILNTVVITVLSVLLGTALGFGLFMLCRSGNKAANAVTRFCLSVIHGTPMVVLLMVLFYIVFGKLSVSGSVVAVFGFALTFGSAVFGILNVGIGAIDHGQYEAACALGYSGRKAFFRYILPQALPAMAEPFKHEVIGLIQATAVVGYIAVQDLTKMGDIVRSRTYEAFFPLISVTLIYFLLEGILAFIISRIGRKTDKRQRKQEDILKGVLTHDQN